MSVTLPKSMYKFVSKSFQKITLVDVGGDKFQKTYNSD